MIGAGVVLVLVAVVAWVVVATRPAHQMAAPADLGEPSSSVGPAQPTDSATPSPSPSPTASPTGSATASPTRSASPSNGPVAGLAEYTDTYNVQHPYDLSASDRFSVTGEVYNTWILQGDKAHSPSSATGPRTEMRWASNWSGGEHLWEADVLIDPGTEHTCIMQVKSNTAGEAIYINVRYGGNLYNGTHTLLATAMWGKWFHLASAYNPTTGRAGVWINNTLVDSGTSVHPAGTQWYFKNGVYNLDGAKAQAHFKHIRMWRG
jgi:hypothetical protein